MIVPWSPISQSYVKLYCMGQKYDPGIFLIIYFREIQYKTNPLNI